MSEAQRLMNRAIIELDFCIMFCQIIREKLGNAYFNTWELRDCLKIKKMKGKSQWADYH